MSVLDGTLIQLFEPQDKFSRLDLNSNFQRISDMLLGHKEQIDSRARIATGTYIGANGAIGSVTDYAGTVFTHPFAAASAGTDRTITLPFEPKLLVIEGSRIATVNWSGKGSKAIEGQNGYETVSVDISLTGTAYQAFRQIVCAGQSVGWYKFAEQLPSYVNNASLKMAGFAWSSTSDSGNALAFSEITENEDGTWSVLLKAVQPNDILGLVYHWVAIG